MNEGHLIRMESINLLGYATLVDRGNLSAGSSMRLDLANSLPFFLCIRLLLLIFNGKYLTSAIHAIE
jgi:hypothetical protein